MRFYVMAAAVAIALAVAITAGVLEAGRIKSGFALSSDDELRIYRQVAANSPPGGAVAGAFRPEIGAKVPASVMLQSLPGPVTNRIPKVSKYDYVMTPIGLALVDPGTRKVVDVING